MKGNMNVSDDLKLYKLITDNEDTSYVSEFGWISDSEFVVWVNYIWFQEFMEELTKIFGYGIFDDGGFTGKIQSHSIAIDLCEAVGCCVDVEEIFPKDKYKH